MASQNESDEKSRTDEVEKRDSKVESRGGASTELETKELEIKPYSNEDPLRASRIDALAGETQNLLDKISVEAVGFDRANSESLSDIHKDAVERSKWRPARQDAFIGILRLGNPVPPRSKRVL